MQTIRIAFLQLTKPDRKTHHEAPARNVTQVFLTPSIISSLKCLAGAPVDAIRAAPVQLAPRLRMCFNRSNNGDTP
jgi:hypothetical protein